MIVRCPDCQTHYRFEPPPAGALDQGRCSRCEGIVPLIGIRQAYVVLSPSSRYGPVAPPQDVPPMIGMDDPTLAGQIRGSALLDPAGQGTPVTYRMMSGEDGVADPTALAEPEPLSLQPSLQGTDIAEQAPPPGAALDPPESSPGTAPRPRRRASRLLVALLLGVAGAAAGYYTQQFELLQPVRPHPSVAPLDLTLVGGLLGLFLGWAVVRWTTRKR